MKTGFEFGRHLIDLAGSAHGLSRAGLGTCHFGENFLTVRQSLVDFTMLLSRRSEIIIQQPLLEQKSIPPRTDLHSETILELSVTARSINRPSTLRKEAFLRRVDEGCSGFSWSSVLGAVYCSSIVISHVAYCQPPCTAYDRHLQKIGNHLHAVRGGGNSELCHEEPLQHTDMQAQLRQSRRST